MYFFALQKIKEYPEIQRDVDEEHGILKENAVQFFYSVLEAPAQEEVEDYIKFGIEKLNQAGIKCRSQSTASETDPWTW